MNERIRELAEQAGFENGHQDRYGNSLSQELEKFAKLIVKEMCGMVEQTGDDLYAFPPSERPIQYIGFLYEWRTRFEEHFGVEVECNQEEQEKFAPKHKCSVCGTTENVRWMGGYQPYLCDSVDCIPF